MKLPSVKSVFVLPTSMNWKHFERQKPTKTTQAVAKLDFRKKARDVQVTAVIKLVSMPSLNSAQYYRGSR